MQDNFAPYRAQNYGASPAKPNMPIAAASVRLNAWAMVSCLLMPLVLFSSVSWLLTSAMHFDSPRVCWGLVFFAALLVVLVNFMAGKMLYLRFSGQVTKGDPTWYVFLAISLAIAWGAAVFLGNVNYWSNVRPVKDVEFLSNYQNIDVSQVKGGQQLMDSGRITFAEGTHLDLSLSMGFKNLERYCVAPITIGNATMPNYDFWAVGLNCCSGRAGAGDFHCGEYNNAKARSGLRLMREDQRPYYRLAVQQAQASFGFTSNHPLFFYWMQDPAAELEAYDNDAFKYYTQGLLCFFCFQMCLLLAVVILRMKCAPR